jgi:hypothetical protein
MPNLFEEFRTVVAALNRAAVPFAVCGGLAMSIYARPRATVDIDLLAPPDAIPALIAAVAPLGFTQREQEPTRLAEGEVLMHRLTKIVPGDPEVLVLDVIEVRGGATTRVWESRGSMEWQGSAVPVVSREGLIAMKRLRGSPQDMADILALEGGA